MRKSGQATPDTQATQDTQATPDTRDAWLRARPGAAAAAALSIGGLGFQVCAQGCTGESVCVCPTTWWDPYNCTTDLRVVEPSGPAPSGGRGTPPPPPPPLEPACDVTAHVDTCPDACTIESVCTCPSGANMFNVNITGPPPPADDFNPSIGIGVVVEVPSGGRGTG